ncbi:hypothetical protein DKW60_14315 [Leucothrix pacifica]|uniref:DUF3080 domain-containing protein n=2 Tax=Leucothrix pacifica TaxID=1247513 RepID=A0A317CB52_9GAMM|nr:hypothetical protein DKW60_14315 [Leucothrix pacifica]
MHLSFLHRPIHLLAALSLLMLLTACQVSAPQAMLEDYTARMSNVLTTDIKLNLGEAALAIPAFPAKRDRVVATQELREGLWDVLDFRQCDMLSLISERNSSLGKVMLPSQKMRYELRFIVALQACRKILVDIEEPDDTQLAFQERLDAIYQTKSDNLPREIWNGIYGADEISQHFKIGTPPLALDTDSGNPPRYALQQLSGLATLSRTDSITLPAWLEQVEAPYETLHHSEFGASLLSSLVMMTQTLDRTAQAIETRLQAKPFCFPGHKPPRATTLYNVFQKFYAGKVQPYMAVIQRQGSPWFALHDELIQQLPATDSMNDYRQQVLGMNVDGSLWDQWVKARQRHTQAWQDILGQCNMMPGSQTRTD